MSERIMTLFGEEIVPEQPKPVAKTRGKKKAEESTQALEAPTAEQEPEGTPAGNEESIASTAEEVTTAEENETASQPETVAIEIAAEAVIAPVAAPMAEMVNEPEAATVEEITATAEPVTKKKRNKVNEENIILPEDWNGDKTYYTIGEVADLFKVKTSHIRFWTNEFKLKVRTTRKGDRLYTPDQIRELRTIHHLVKERGFTLTGAKAKLKEKNNREVHTIDLKQSLQQLRSKLVIIRNQLK